MINRMVGRWRCESGYREVLIVGIPLILSTSMWSVQHFTDRMFLAWYAPEAVAASMPAGLVNFTVMSFFVGTASYVGTFVAQYYGANRPERIGPVLWQALYVAMLAGVVHLCLIPFVPTIFRVVSHEPLVQRYEIIYMQVLCLAAGPGTANAAMSGFFAGRGKTWPVLWVNVAAAGSTVAVCSAVVSSVSATESSALTGVSEVIVPASV